MKPLVVSLSIFFAAFAAWRFAGSRPRLSRNHSGGVQLAKGKPQTWVRYFDVFGLVISSYFNIKHSIA